MTTPRSATQKKPARPDASPRVALYERVSTDRQEYHSQHHALESYCQRQGWNDCAIYAEKESRANTKRTQLNQLLIDARLGKFSVVVVFRLDRLGSRPLHMLQVIEELRHLKIRFISVNDHVDTADQSGRTDMLIGIMTAVSGNELASIRERIKAGQAAARKKGKRLGRPPLDPKKIARVEKLGAQGKTYEEISKTESISEASISRILQRDKKKTKR